MKGVQYFYDESGKPQAVMIDLRKNRQLWEDLQDVLVSEGRLKEKRVLLDEVKGRLRKKGVILHSRFVSPVPRCL